jgi:hypothetical protein
MGGTIRRSLPQEDIYGGKIINSEFINSADN